MPLSRPPSRRFSSFQPNVPGRGIVAAYSIRFWTAVVAIGLFSGLCGAGLLELLTLIQKLFWGSRGASFLAVTSSASALHRLLVLAGAGVLAAIGGLALRRMRSSGGAEVTEAVWVGGGEMALGPSAGRSLLSIAIVAMGASLGREAAPQLAGAAGAAKLCELARLPRWQRRLLVACGAGAGMAAVYNVPLGGALFALEVLLGTLALPLVLPALATTLIATATAWIALPDRLTYTIPNYPVPATLVVATLVLGPLAGLVAVGWVNLVGVMNRHRPRGRARLGAPIAAMVALGLLSIWLPELLGNGKDVVQLALVGGLGLGVIAPLVLLKPLVTAGCLGSGAPGGLFTPTLALGVLFGALLGHAWGSIWPGAPVGALALIGGGAVLAASMQGPIAALVLMLELAGSQSLMVPLLLAVTAATVVSRLLGAPSIYSARLGEQDQLAGPRPKIGILDELDAPAPA